MQNLSTLCLIMQRSTAPLNFADIKQLFPFTPVQLCTCAIVFSFFPISEDNNDKIKSWPASPAKSRDQNHSSPSRNQPSTQSFLGKIFSSMFNYKVRQSPRHNSLEISETFQIDHHYLPNT